MHLEYCVPKTWKLEKFFLYVVSNNLKLLICKFSLKIVQKPFFIAENKLYHGKSIRISLNISYMIVNLIQDSHYKYNR